MPPSPARRFAAAPVPALAMLAVACAAPSPSSAAGPQRAPVHVDSCVPCHGEDGIARDVEVPHLAGQNVVYLLNQLRAFRSGKRPHKEMRFMSRPMTEAEMEALAEYYAALPRS